MKAKFDKQFGDEDNEAIETINPWAYLRDELEKDENWYSSSPMDESVTRRELPETETEIVVSTDGTVRVDQLAVPLDITLEKIGENKVTNFSKFNISGATLKRMLQMDPIKIYLSTLFLRRITLPLLTIKNSVTKKTRRGNLTN